MENKIGFPIGDIFLPENNDGRIGGGCQGQVFKKIANGTTYAVKCRVLPLDPSQHDAVLKSIQQEARIMERAQVDNQYCLQGGRFFFEHRSVYYYVMDFAEHGNLRSLIKEIGPVPEDALAVLTAHILTGIETLHNKLSFGYIHGDMKSDNVSIDDNGFVRVIDFGCCTPKKDPYRCGAFCTRSPTYFRKFETVKIEPINDNSIVRKEEEKEDIQSNISQGPQFLAEEAERVKSFLADGGVGAMPPGPHTDIWNVGNIVFECFYGFPPQEVGFDAGTWPDNGLVTDPIMSSPVPIPSQELRDFLSFSTCKNPQARWDAESLLGCDFLRHVEVGSPKDLATVLGWINTAKANKHKAAEPADSLPIAISVPSTTHDAHGQVAKASTEIQRQQHDGMGLIFEQVVESR